MEYGEHLLKVENQKSRKIIRNLILHQRLHILLENLQINHKISKET